jgi:hypothetical protein
VMRARNELPIAPELAERLDTIFAPAAAQAA